MAPVGRAEGHAVDWRVARRAIGAPATRRDLRTARQPTGCPEHAWWATSEERAATSVRRAGGEATLRRRRVLLVAARSSARCEGGT